LKDPFQAVYLLEAVISDNLVELSRILKLGVDTLSKTYCLNWACTKGSFEMVKLLIDHGADIYDPHVYYSAIKGGNLDVVKYLEMKLKNDDISLGKALKISVKSNNLDITNYLIEKISNEHATISQDEYLEIITILVNKVYEVSDSSEHEKIISL